MRRAAGWLLAALLPACGDSTQPQSSGTNTSWLHLCDSADDCSGAAECLCGLCTVECDATSECPAGVCGSALATNLECGTTTSARLCLPAHADAGACVESLIPTDSELDSGASATCDVPGAILCESFDAPLPASYSTWYESEPYATLQDCWVARGAGAVRYQSAQGDYSQTRMRLPTPVASGPLYVRFYAYLPSSLVIPAYLGLFELWTEDVNLGDKLGVDVVANDVLQINIVPADVLLRSAESALRRDEWMCIELALEIAEGDGSVAVTIDGETVIESSSGTTALEDPYRVAVIEGLPSDDATFVDLALDDLVIATEPIGCPRD